MAERERWEGIRDAMVAETNSNLSDLGSARSNRELFWDACKRIAQQEEQIRKLSDRAEKLATLVARFADDLESVANHVRDADELLGASDA